ncbi:MAG TPA: hypothetical protein VLL52_25575, partial [Anaerolineae bacterium]|nr:hypothetical protein [Anaerolineae bacterium]
MTPALLRHRARRQARRRPRTRRRRFLAITFTLLALPILLFLATTLTLATLYATAADSLPNLDTITTSYQEGTALNQTTQIFAQGSDNDNDGRPDPILLAEINDPLATTRRWLTLDDIPLIVQQATVVALDPTFWQKETDTPLHLAQTFAQAFAPHQFPPEKHLANHLIPPPLPTTAPL